MLIKNNQIKLSVDNCGQINQIFFNNENILHDGKESWNKIYPMIWPVIGFSNGFEINNKNYQITKHGFWNQLDWNKAYENNGITLFATHLANEKYPFSIDIQQSVSINKNKITINTFFSNLSKEEAYFHFGHHPAFKIDNNSIIESMNGFPQIIDLKGKLKKEIVKIKEISKLKFGIDYDTLVYKKNDYSVFLRNNKYDIEVDAPDFDAVQIWKPKSSQFICIEPWQGYGDREYDSPKKASEKIDIIKLQKGEIKSFEVNYLFHEKKHMYK